jgi:hypothetical protein
MKTVTRLYPKKRYEHLPRDIFVNIDQINVKCVENGHSFQFLNQMQG